MAKTKTKKEHPHPQNKKQQQKTNNFLRLVGCGEYGSLKSWFRKGSAYQTMWYKRLPAVVSMKPFRPSTLLHLFP